MLANKPIGASANRIAKCPVCSYDLEGLPDKHKYPECGCDYDRNSAMISFSPMPALVRWFFISVSLILFVGACFELSKGKVSLFLFALYSLFLCRRIISRKKCGEIRAILSKNGIELTDGNRRCESIEWSEIDRLIMPVLTSKITIKCTGERTIKIPLEFFGTTAQGKLFVRSAREWLADYRKREISEQANAEIR